MDILQNKRFKEVRLLLNLSQVEFAEKISLKQGTVSDIERNRIGVTNKVAQQLFTNLGVNQVWFYTGQEKPFKGEVDIVNSDKKGDKKYKGGESETIRAVDKLLNSVYEEGMTMEKIKEVLLKKASLLKNKGLYYSILSTTEIEKERPDLSNARKFLSDFALNVDILNQINSIYFEGILDGDIEFSDYDSFKQNRIRKLEFLLQYSDMVKPFNKAAKHFITVFKSSDTNNLIDYYDEEK